MWEINVCSLSTQSTWCSGKESTCQCRRHKRCGSGRSPGEWNGNPLQHSCLGNPMDRGVWQATVPVLQRVGHHLATKQQQLCCFSKITQDHTSSEQLYQNWISVWNQSLAFSRKLYCLKMSEGNYLNISRQNVPLAQPESNRLSVLLCVSYLSSLCLGFLICQMD